ncbi:FAD:protein FMN transferase [Rosistilla oblonga]|uniref:FAD:protein FMN transferase n=1 Tax=Rosistilla oblonga TaxID=2527990 RepID=A0A518INP0_9BACT|nr:FAD:protein FMN transferase [Rosistilla oblonga]QDV54697.1 Thiamine biosynthesis lipoprotein ApbE precursor [Rosistilla oblonga]
MKNVLQPKSNSAANPLNNAASPSENSPSIARPGELISVIRPAMATEFEVLMPADVDREAPEIALEALEWIRTLEGIFSVYRSDSDISKLNREAAERPVRVDPHLFKIVQQAIAISDATGGAFDITAGPLVDAWGFTNRSGRKPSDEELAAALQAVGYQNLELDADQQTIRFKQPEMRINLGAIGKGYALDQAVAMLVTSGVENFLIHGGQSSIVARGSRRPGEPGWPIALSHPIRSHRKLGRVWLQNESLSTSGSGKQFFHYRGQRLGHMIDPRTGWPGGDLLSLTLIAKVAAESDALATGLFVDGMPQATQFVEANPGLGIVGVAEVDRSSEVEVVAVAIADERWEPFQESSRDLN